MGGKNTRVERVNLAVQLVNTDALNGPAPLLTILDHLLG